MSSTIILVTFTPATISGYVFPVKLIVPKLEQTPAVGMRREDRYRGNDRIAILEVILNQLEMLSFLPPSSFKRWLLKKHVLKLPLVLKQESPENG
jgi:hypothetical protein